MDNFKTVFVAGLTALLLSGLVWMLAPQGPSGQPAAGISSPDIPSPYFSFGGVRFWGARTDTLTAATTTVCALRSPAATSTLVSGSIRFAVGSTTASTVYLAKAATAYATTTSLGYAALAANAQGNFVASTTSSSDTILDGLANFAPNTYFVVGMAGGTGTFSPTGTCQAVWRAI